MSYTNINGKLVSAENAAIGPDNSAFRYGVGLFETMLVENGNIRLKQYHWERLFSGLQTLDFDLPAHFSPAMLEEEVIKTVKKNQLEHLCRVRLQLYGGSGGIFGPDRKNPLFVIECYPLEPGTLLLNHNGLVVGPAEGLRKSNDSLGNLKASNALIYAMAARQAKQHKWNDALIFNTTGNIIESAIANIFWIKDNTIFTPPLTEGCVAGVMRRHILQSVKNIAESILTKNVLLEADEVFLTNAIKAIKWVGTFEGAAYGNSRTRALSTTLF